MFIRWQVRKRATRPYQGDLLVCRLVKSERDDRGRPRQRLVKQLGSIREAMPTNHRIAFWQGVEWAIGQIDIRPDEATKIRTQVAKRVPFTSEDEREFYR